jgi:hypothetical protein
MQTYLPRLPDKVSSPVEVEVVLFFSILPHSRKSLVPAAGLKFGLILAQNKLNA